MTVSARSLRTAGLSLTAATALAFTPLVIPPGHPAVPVPTVSVPTVSVPDIRLAVTASEIGALAGMPVAGLIGVVENIVTLFDDTFTTAIAATSDPTVVAALTILRTVAVDAWAKLAENLGRINVVVTSTATEVSELVSDTTTRGLRHVVEAAVDIVEDPRSPDGYAALTAAGRQVADNSVAAVRSVGEAGADIGRIAVSELTFQVHNLGDGLGALVTELADPRPAGFVVTERPAAVESGSTDVEAQTGGVERAPRGRTAVAESVSVKSTSAESPGSETTGADGASPGGVSAGIER